MEVHARDSTTLTFWDSFEWGLWFGGHLLYSCGRVYRLCGRKEGWLGGVVAEEETQGRPRLWRDFRSGEMRERLQRMLGLRGLAPVAEGTIGRQRRDLRNATGKIVCRLECATVSAGKRGGEELLHYCLVLPLLGYEADAERVVQRLTLNGANPCDAGPLELLLRAAHREPRPYTLRPLFGLRFDTPARDAVGRIVSPILGIAEENVPGILDDIDTEFLHDYRICLRKTRSVLGLVKGVYPPEETRRMRGLLGDLARRTNRLRDLDVYLLAKEEYLELLPPGLRPALERMFLDLTAERGRELRRVSAELHADPTRLLFQEIKAFFAGAAPHGAAPAAELPVGPLVFLRVYKTYRKIRRGAALIGADTPDEGVHQLRIECKKLRYLLEFFAELVPEKRGAPLVKSLRRLQNWLGEFNDASVQQQALMAYWQEKGSGTDLAMGLGGLVSVLYERQRRTRRYILDALEEFTGDATGAAFKRIFKQGASLPAARAQEAQRP